MRHMLHHSLGKPLDNLGGYQFQSILDIKSNVSIRIKCLAFTAELLGLYENNGLHFGLSDAPANYQPLV